MKITYRCRECNNKCKLKMVLCPSGNESPTSCLYSDATIKPVWVEVVK